MFRLSLKKNGTSRNCYLKATQIEPQDTTNCVCAKCHTKVPYVSRRCLAVEDENGTINFFGKSFTLTNLCMNCIREI
jgi:hypothetical protein